MRPQLVTSKKSMCDKCSIYKAVDEDFEHVELKQIFDKLTNKIADIYLVKLKEELQNAENLPLTKAFSIDKLLEAVTKLIAKAYTFGQKTIFAQVQDETIDLQPLLPLDETISFAISPDPAVNYAKERAGELIRWVTDNVQNTMQKLVTNALTEGRTQTKLKEEIQAKFEQFTSTRSALIARQEVALANGWWRYNQFTKSAQQFGQIGRKKAYTQGDDNVRPSHRANADEWWIMATQPFQGTGSMYEPFGFNCRCRVTYLIYKPE